MAAGVKLIVGLSIALFVLMAIGYRSVRKGG